MSKYAIAHAFLSKEIQIGRLNKAGNTFLDDKEYHTNEAVWAVIQHVLEDYNGSLDIGVGDKRYIITVETKETN